MKPNKLTKSIKQINKCKRYVFSYYKYAVSLFKLFIGLIFCFVILNETPDIRKH